MELQHDSVLGRILHANTRGFTFGTRVPRTDVPIFGSFIKTFIAHRATTIYGVIYNIEIKENGMAKMLSVSESVRAEDIAWLKEQVVPVEASVLCVAYQERNPPGPLRQSLPAQPPITLDEVRSCTHNEIAQVTASPAYLRLILDFPDAPADELIAASTRLVQEAYLGSQAASDFVLATGRELARLLARDSSRLEGLLQRICA